MARKSRDRTVLRKGQRVIATEGIGRVPEGSLGVVKLVNGFEWIRYWVAWDTGDWIGSIDGSAIVAADRYEEYKREKAEALLRPAAAPASAVAATDDAPSGTGTGGVPEHLLARSRARRAALSA